MKIKTKKFNCPYCAKEFLRGSMGYTNHMKAHHSNEYTTGLSLYPDKPASSWPFIGIYPTLREDYPRKTAQLVGLGSKNANKYSCPWCAELFHKKGLLTHIQHCKENPDNIPVITSSEARFKALFGIMEDKVNYPTHYTSSPSGIECIDAIEAALSHEEFRGYIKGNVIKYSWREKLKGGDEDLKKARWYLSRLVDRLDKLDNEKGDVK